MQHVGAVRETIPDLYASPAFLAALHSTCAIDVITQVKRDTAEQLDAWDKITCAAISQ